MRQMEKKAQSLARARVAASFRARVPSGSLSHLSGNLLAAPEVVCQPGFSLAFVVDGIVQAENVQWTTTLGLYPPSRQRCLRAEEATLRLT